jgi:hypothetical protein
VRMHPAQRWRFEHRRIEALRGGRISCLVDSPVTSRDTKATSASTARGSSTAGTGTGCHGARPWRHRSPRDALAMRVGQQDASGQWDSYQSNRRGTEALPRPSI